jgi:hypothetical protein
MLGSDLTRIDWSHLPDLVLLGSPEDALLRELGRHCTAVGSRAALTTREDFARHTTLTINGSRVVVDPDIPTFIRWETRSRISGSSDRFVATELFAHNWSVFALMRSPVINRPTAARGSDWHSRTLMVRLWSEARSSPASTTDLRHETYSSTFPSQPRLMTEPLWPTSEHSNEKPAGYRSRSDSPEDWANVHAVVVGQRAWLRSLDKVELDWLRSASVRTAECLELQFCAIDWCVSPDSLRAHISDVDSHPSLASMGDLAVPVTAAIVEHMLR